MWFAFHQAFRSLRHAPGAPAACAAAIAVGAGAATAVFAVVYGVLLRPLPFSEADRLVQFAAATPDRSLGFSLPELDDWRARPNTLDAVAVLIQTPMAVAEDGQTSALAGAAVSANLFELLGMPMIAGRSLQSADDNQPVAVISERIWRTKFAADPAVVGRGLTVNGETVTIVGVAPAALALPSEEVDLWTSTGYARRSAPPQWGMRGFRGFSMVGRLRSATSLSAAQGEITRVGDELASEYPRFNRDTRVNLVPMRERMVTAVRPVLLLVSAAMVLVIVAVGANLVNLQLARSVDRQREQGIRLALGAHRQHLVMQALAETVIIAAVAGAAAVVIASFVIELIRIAAPAGLPRLAEVRVDWRATAFALGASIVVLGISAVMPMWRARSAAVVSLRQARIGQTRGGRRAHSVLMVVQIAMSMALVTGTAMLGRSLLALMDVDPGVRSDRAAIVRLSMAAAAFNSPASQTAFLTRLLARVDQLPGVRVAGLVSSLPPTGSQMRTSVSPPAQSGQATGDVQVEVVAASAGTFGALGVQVERGRQFTDADTADAPRVLIVSEGAARTLFPDRDAVGQVLPLGGMSGGGAPPTIVGVVGDVRFGGLESAPGAAIYLPFSQRPFRATNLVIRVDGGLEAVARALPAAVREVDPSVAVGAVRPLTDVVAAAGSPSRVRLTAVALLAAIALIVAGVGLYGVVAYGVASRSREYAVRIALGLPPRGIVRLVLTGGLGLVLAGTVVGCVLAVGLGRIASTLLFGVSPFDPLSFGVAVLCMTVVGISACVVPAWRASQVEPMLVLRAD